jgi:hypothetical protein
VAAVSPETIRASVQAAWTPFEAVVSRLSPAELVLNVGNGWTVKELLSHVAFWDEAVEGYVTLAIRLRELPNGWTFGSGYEPDDGPWPHFEVHNAREAAWAREHNSEAVLERVETAHRALARFLETITEEEAAEHAEYFGQLGQHYREHLADLEAAASPSR